MSSTFTISSPVKTISLIMSPVKIYVVPATMLSTLPGLWLLVMPIAATANLPWILPKNPQLTKQSPDLFLVCWMVPLHQPQQPLLVMYMSHRNCAPVIVLSLRIISLAMDILQWILLAIQFLLKDWLCFERISLQSELPKTNRIDNSFIRMLQYS